MKNNDEMIQFFYITFNDFHIENINNRCEIITFSKNNKEVFRIFNYKTMSDKVDLYTWYINISILNENIRIPYKNTKDFIELFRRTSDELINIQNNIEEFRTKIFLFKDQESLKCLIRDNKINKLL